MSLAREIMDSDDEGSGDELVHSHFHNSASSIPNLVAKQPPRLEIQDSQAFDAEDEIPTDTVMADASPSTPGNNPSQMEGIQDQLKLAHAALLAPPTPHDTPSSGSEPSPTADMTRKRPKSTPTRASTSPKISRKDRLSEFDFEGSDEDELPKPSNKRAKTESSVSQKKKNKSRNDESEQIEQLETFQLDDDGDDEYVGGKLQKAGDTERRIPTRGKKKEEPLLMLAMRKARGKAALKTLEQPGYSAEHRSSSNAEQVPSSNDTWKTGDTALSALEPYVKPPAYRPPADDSFSEYQQRHFNSEDYQGTPTQPITRDINQDEIPTQPVMQNEAYGSAPRDDTVGESPARRANLAVEVPPRSSSVGPSSGDDSVGKRRKQKIDEEVMSSMQAAAVSEFGLRKKRSIAPIQEIPEDEEDDLFPPTEPVTPKVSKRHKTTGDIPDAGSKPIKKKAAKGKGKKAKAADFSDASEDEQPVAKKAKAKTKKPAAKVKSPVKPKSAPIVIDNTDEESALSSVQDLSEDELTAVVKKPSPKRKAAALKQTKASRKQQKAKEPTPEPPTPVEDDEDVGPLSQELEDTQLEESEKENEEREAVKEPEPPVTKAPTPAFSPPMVKNTKGFGELASAGKSLSSIVKKNGGPQRRVGLSRNNYVPPLLQSIKRPPPAPPGSN